jgi:hypothetical protein
MAKKTREPMTRTKVAELALTRLQEAIKIASEAADFARGAELHTIAGTIEDSIGTLNEELSYLFESVRTIRERGE